MSVKKYKGFDYTEEFAEDLKNELNIDIINLIYSHLDNKVSSLDVVVGNKTYNITIQKVKYSIYTQELDNNYIVEFDGVRSGKVVKVGNYQHPEFNLHSTHWEPHTNIEVWKILDKDKALDLIRGKKIELVYDTYESEIKTKFNSNNYRAFYSSYDDKRFYECNDVDDLRFKYKLVHKRHSDILDYFLNDRKNVKIEYLDIEWGWIDISGDFLDFYDEKYEFRIKKFVPFTVTIDINSLDSAKDLWNRLNLTSTGLIDWLKASENTFKDISSFEHEGEYLRIWNDLNKVIEKFESSK